jgi:predicted alpha/beta-fold hydrolase
MVHKKQNSTMRKLEIILPFGSLSTIMAPKISKKASSQEIKSSAFSVEISDGSVLTGELDEKQNSQPIANILLVHGLASSCHDPSVVRQAHFLAQKGFRVLRLNHRNAGSGKNKAIGFYHADRSQDIVDALVGLTKVYSQHSWIIVGQSLSGNMLLKALGEAKNQALFEQCKCIGAIAVSPIIDLGRSSKRMKKPLLGFFDQVFTQAMKAYLNRIDNGIGTELKNDIRSARNLAELDEKFVAKALGLQNAEEYYSQATAMNVLESIKLPTTIIFAKNDPIAPGTLSIIQAVQNPLVKKCITVFGGHLSFLSVSLPEMRLAFAGDRKVWESCQDLVRGREC